MKGSNGVFSSFDCMCRRSWITSSLPQLCLGASGGDPTTLHTETCCLTLANGCWKSSALENIPVSYIFSYVFFSAAQKQLELVKSTQQINAGSLGVKRLQDAIVQQRKQRESFSDQVCLVGFDSCRKEKRTRTIRTCFLVSPPQNVKLQTNRNVSNGALTWKALFCEKELNTWFCVCVFCVKVLTEWRQKLKAPHQMIWICFMHRCSRRWFWFASQPERTKNRHFGKSSLCTN